MNTRPARNTKTSTIIAKTTARDRRGTRSSKAPPSDVAGEFQDPSVCESCAAVYSKRTWRRSDRPLTHALLEKADWTRCPACRQKKKGLAYGRVIAKGDFDGRRLGAIERRVTNVVERAKFTQPERKLVSMDRVDGGLDVLTTSQKLAHRIVVELKKAFGGRARYTWDDGDGSLLAVWSA